MLYKNSCFANMSKNERDIKIDVAAYLEFLISYTGTLLIMCVCVCVCVCVCLLCHYLKLLGLPAVVGY